MYCTFNTHWSLWFLRNFFSQKCAWLTWVCIIVLAVQRTDRGKYKSVRHIHRCKRGGGSRMLLFWSPGSERRNVCGGNDGAQSIKSFLVLTSRLAKMTKNKQIQRRHGGGGDINANDRSTWIRGVRIHIIVALLVSFIGITTTCLVPNIVDYILVKVTDFSPTVHHIPVTAVDGRNAGCCQLHARWTMHSFHTCACHALLPIITSDHCVEYQKDILSNVLF